MVVINDILYLGFKTPSGEKELLQWFSEDSLKKSTKEYRKGLSSNYLNIPDPSDGRKILISYDSIPEATRIAKNIPAKEILLEKYKEQRMLTFCTLHTEAYQYFLKCADVKNTATATREAIAKGKAEQVGYLCAIAKMKPTDVRQLGYPDKDTFYAACLVAMQKLAQERKWYKFKLTTLKSLRKRLKPVQQMLKGKVKAAECFGTFVSKRANNKNRELLEEDQKAFLIQQYSDANAKLNIEQLYAIYKRKAVQLIEANIWPEYVLPNSANTLRNYLHHPNVTQLWFEARHGYQEYRNQFENITHRLRASFANALWVIDGTPWHRYFRDGKYAKYNRLNIFVVLDAYSYCVLGFWVSERENTESVIGALRSACHVSDCLPYQVLYDNGSAIQSYLAQHTIQTISTVHFAATAGNARSKVIEGHFHWMNENVGKFRKGFTHNPFAKRLDNRPNREALALMVRNDELSEVSTAVQELIEDFTIANNMPRPVLGNRTPWEAYTQSVKQTAKRQRPFTETIDVEAFWTQPGEHKRIKTYVEGKPSMVSQFIPQQYEFTNRGFEITIGGKKCYYDVEDAAFRAGNYGQKFTVRYEPNPDRWINGQPAQLLLYLQGAPVQWQGMHLAALPTERMPMAVADYQQGTREQLTRKLNLMKQQRSITQQRLADVIKLTKQNGTYQEVATGNAFDKETLAAAEAKLLNDYIGYPGDGPTDDEPDNHQPTTKTDRLHGYEEQEFIH